MKKILGFMVVVGVSLFMTAQGFALDITNTAGNAGDGIEVTTTNVDGVNTFSFNPSPQVWIDGISQASSFAVAAVHNQALGTTGGKEYGMAYDSTKVYWLDVGDPSVTAMTDVSTSDSTAFPSGTWFY